MSGAQRNSNGTVSLEEVDIIRNLLEDFNIGVDSVLENDTLSALHYACWHERLDLVKQLVESGSRVDHRDINGATCLHYSAFSLDFDTIDYLLNTSIDPKIQNKNGKTALWLLLDEYSPGDYDIDSTVLQNLVDKTIQVDPETLNYKFDEFFELTVLACVKRVMSDYFINKFYSKNNSRYELISEIESCSFEGIAFADHRYYFYAFCHDQITRQHIMKTIDCWFYTFDTSYYAMIEKSVESDDVNSLILKFFHYLDTIGFYDALHEEDSSLKRLISKNIGFFALHIVSEKLSSQSHSKRLHKVIDFLSQKGFNINLMLEYFLNIFLCNSSIHYKAMFKIIPILLPFVTDLIKIISRFVQREDSQKFLDIPEVKEYFTELFQSYGNTTEQGRINGFNLKVFSLKHICRNHIRSVFLESSSYSEFFKRMDQLNSELPKKLVAYLKFDEVHGVY